MPGRSWRSAAYLPRFPRRALLLCAALALGPAACNREDPLPAPWFELDSANSALLPATGSYFLAWGDADNDRYPDLWVGLHGGARLLLNRGGTFADVTEQWVSVPDGDNHGAAWHDFDRDGDQDLVELLGAARGIGPGGANRLFRNDGGKLQLVKADIGLALPELRGRVPLWLDFDADGKTDLLLTAREGNDLGNMILLRRHGRFVPGEGPWALGGSSEYGQLAYGPSGEPYLVLHLRDYPGAVYRWQPGQGLAPATLLPVTVPNVADSLWADLDNNGTDDLVVARNMVSSRLQQPDAQTLRAFVMKPERLGQRSLAFTAGAELAVEVYPYNPVWWHEDNIFAGARSLRETGPATVIGAYQGLAFTLRADHASGAAPAQLPDDRGLLFSFFPAQNRWQVQLRSNMGDDVNLVVRAPQGITGVELTPEDQVEPPEARLFLAGAGGYARATLAPGLEQCQAVAGGDFDNDADVDLAFYCGDILAGGHLALVENLGGGRFRALPPLATAIGDGTPDAITVVDYNRDGALDLVTSNGRGKYPFNQGPIQFFRGKGNGNHWLLVDLTPPPGRDFPAGSRLELRAGEQRQYRTVGAAVRANGADDVVVHFGLGQAAQVDELLLHLPGGETIRRAVPAVDQRLAFFAE